MTLAANNKHADFGLQTGQSAQFVSWFDIATALGLDSEQDYIGSGVRDLRSTNLILGLSASALTKYGKLPIQSKPKGRLLVVGVKSYGGPKRVLPKPTRPPLRQLDAADVNMQTPRARQGGNGALPVGEHAPHAGLGQGGLDDDGDGSVDGDPPDGEQARDPHDGEQECLRCGQVNEPDVADCYYCKNPFPAPGADNNDGFFAPQPTGGKGRGSTVQHAEDRAQQLQTLRSEATMVRSLMNVGGLNCLRPQAIWIANELAKGKSIGGGSDGSGGLEHNELFKEDSGMLREGAGELKVCVLDGALRASFPFIEAQMPWLTTMWCSCHILSLFFKDCFSGTNAVPELRDALAKVKIVDAKMIKSAICMIVDHLSMSAVSQACSLSIHRSTICVLRVTSPCMKSSHGCRIALRSANISNP